MRAGLSSFAEENEKSALVMMANGAVNRCLWPTQMQVGDVYGTHPRNRYIVIKNNSFYYPSLYGQDLNSDVSSHENYWRFAPVSQGNECPSHLPSTGLFKDLPCL